MFFLMQLTLAETSIQYWVKVVKRDKLVLFLILKESLLLIMMLPMDFFWLPFIELSRFLYIPRHLLFLSWKGVRFYQIHIFIYWDGNCFLSFMLFIWYIDWIFYVDSLFILEINSTWLWYISLSYGARFVWCILTDTIKNYHKQLLKTTQFIVFHLWKSLVYNVSYNCRIMLHSF